MWLFWSSAFTRSPRAVRATAGRNSERRIRFSTDPRGFEYFSRGTKQVNAVYTVYNMKVFSRFRIILLAALFVAIFSPRAEAQSISNIVFSAGASPTSVAPNTPITYTINLTNSSLSVLSNVTVSNTWSQTVFISSAQLTFPSGGFVVITTNGNSLVFNLGGFGSGQRVLTVTLTTTNVGSLTDTITIHTDSDLTSVLSTNVIVTVANAVVPAANLQVSLTSPTFPILVNDVLHYDVTVRNNGSTAVSNVFLNNTFSPSTNLTFINPTGFTNGTLVASLGSISTNTAKTFHITVRPNAPGILTFNTTATATGATNAGNNSASVTNTVGALIFPSSLVITNVGIMAFNPQTSLMEQTLQVMNTGSNVESARVIVLGTTNLLWNAVGTNNTFGTNDNPFVLLGAPLNTGEVVDVLLEFFSLNRKAAGITNTTTYIAVPSGPFDASVGAGGTNSVFQITRFIVLTNGSGGTLIEFTSTPGKSYSILYSDTNSSALTLLAQPPITAQADRTQWVDDGPPKTISHPSNAFMRVYRVRQNN
jgi:uncharacterized repeat protein (TIGR01451 family)